MPASPASFLAAALAEHSVESLHAMHGRPRPWIYWLSLAGVGAALGALPLVPVEITVRSGGVVRPAIERTELKAAIGGRIARVLVRDNDQVAANQPLVELETGDVDERLARNRALQREKSGLVADLGELTAALARSLPGGFSSTDFPAIGAKIKSPVFIRELARFLAQDAVNRLGAIKALAVQDRTLVLAAKGIVTEQECDDARYAATRATADLQLLAEQTLAGWHTQLRDEQTALDQLVSEEKRLQGELALALIRSPASGTVQGLIGLGAGAFVVAGQSLGYVSPEAPLLVETYVSPKDIGGLRPGQAVRLQIDAFPYTQWGLLEGRIQAVAADATSNGSQATFKVLVQPAALALHLRNGATGALRKGMTLTARFVVGRRSLWHVLYEDASAWLGPQDRPSPT